MRDLLLTAIVFGITPIAFYRPWIGVLTYFWLSLMNPHKLSWGFAVTMPFAQIIALATLGGLLFTKDRKKIPWTPELALMIVLGIYFTLSTATAWEPHHAWIRWTEIMKIYLMTFVMTMLIYSKERIRYLLLVASLGIGFYGLKGGIFTLMGGGANMVNGPSRSFIGTNNEIGLALLMVVPILVFLAREEKHKWFKPLLWSVAGLSMLSIIFTYSRGAMLGLAILLPLMFLKSRAKILTLVVFLPLAWIGYQWAPESIFKRASKIETYQEDNSAMQRLQAWSVAWNIAKDFPLTGGGFELEYSPDEARWLSYADRKYDAYGQVSRAFHSLYFQVIGHHGFVAAFLYYLMLFLLLCRLYRLRRLANKRAELQWIGNYADGLFLGMIGFLVTGAFVNVAYFDLMYLFLALTAVMQREADTFNAAQQPAPHRRFASGRSLKASPSLAAATPEHTAPVPRR